MHGMKKLFCELITAIIVLFILVPTPGFAVTGKITAGFMINRLKRLCQAPMYSSRASGKLAKRSSSKPAEALQQMLKDTL